MDFIPLRRRMVPYQFSCTRSLKTRLNSPQVTLGKFVGMYILKAFHFEDQKHSGVTTSTGSH